MKHLKTYEISNQYSDDGTEFGTFVQDGLEVHEGVELTVTGKVTDSLTVMTGGTYMDLSIDKTNNSDLKGKEPTLYLIPFSFNCSSVWPTAATSGHV